MRPGAHEPTDQELIAAINAGSVDAFETLYRRYRDWTVNLAYRFTGNRDDAVDTMQEVFIYVLRKFPGFELTARFKTFLPPRSGTPRSRSATSAGGRSTLTARRRRRCRMAGLPTRGRGALSGGPATT